MAIDQDASYLYVAQTATDDVVRIRLDGSGAPPEQVCAPGALLPMPDGLALDADGNLYVTSFGASALERIRPDGEIELVARDERGLTMNRVTNCAFGGEGLDRLFLANLGGWHISVMTPDTPASPCSTRPTFLEVRGDAWFDLRQWKPWRPAAANRAVFEPSILRRPPGSGR